MEANTAPYLSLIHIYLGKIHRHLGRGRLAGVEDRQHRRLILGGERDLPAAREHHRVAARRILDVEPQVPPPGRVQGEAVVLGVVCLLYTSRCV